MPENEARAWWADVQHVRESIERRRGGAVETTEAGDPTPPGRFARAAAEPPVPRLADLDWPADVPAGGTRRFERAARSERAERGAGSADDVRAARRHTTAATEADRASARGRRSRPELDVARPRSHRPDGDAAASPRGAETTAPAAPPASSRPAAGDATPAPAATPLDVDFERAPALPARRTVQITGRTVPAPRLVEVERRRPGRRPVERVGPRPDRIAMYAVLLGFFLILVAATSAHAAI